MKKKSLKGINHPFGQALLLNKKKRKKNFEEFRASYTYSSSKHLKTYWRGSQSHSTVRYGL